LLSFSFLFFPKTKVFGSNVSWFKKTCVFLKRTVPFQKLTFSPKTYVLLQKFLFLHRFQNLQFWTGLILEFWTNSSFFGPTYVLLQKFLFSPKFTIGPKTYVGSFQKRKFLNQKLSFFEKERTGPIQELVRSKNLCFWTKLTFSPKFLNFGTERNGSFLSKNFRLVQNS
jgi:hypothetical protein